VGHLIGWNFYVHIKSICNFSTVATYGHSTSSTDLWVWPHIWALIGPNLIRKFKVTEFLLFLGHLGNRYLQYMGEPSPPAGSFLVAQKSREGHTPPPPRAA
jgi:hypothetical protein